MSSHHFVKEGQEPALLICDAISYPIIEPLLEWSPLIMVCDHAVDGVLSWGLKIDVVIAPPDKLELLTKSLMDYAPIKILSCHSRDDQLSTAFYFLVASNQQTVSIVARASEELFRNLGNFTTTLGITLTTETLRWLSVRSGKYEKWLPERTEIFIRSGATPVTLNGMVISTEVIKIDKQGIIRLHSNEPFWVGEKL